MQISWHIGAGYTRRITKSRVHKIPRTRTLYHQVGPSLSSRGNAFYPYCSLSRSDSSPGPHVYSSLDGIHVPSLQIHTTSLLLPLHGPITEPSIFDVISPGVPPSHLPDEAKVPPTRNSTTRHHQGLGGDRSLAIDLWVGKGLESASFRGFRLDVDGVHYRCPAIVSLNCREVPQLLEMTSSLRHLGPGMKWSTLWRSWLALYV